jgi:hypothetical protein
MKRAMVMLFCLFFGAIFFICGQVFAEENVNKTGTAAEEFQATGADLENQPDEPVPLEEEMEDEEVVDADA